jgi:WD40 repeat protein
MSEKPYPGLRPFRRDETDIFFGREDQTDELLERLGRSRFIAVLGLSGCGKSSLVRTGLIAGLESGFLASTGPRWRVAEMRPQNKPLANLAQVLFEQHVSLLDSSQSPPEYPNNNQSLRYAFLRAILQRGPLGIREILSQHPLPRNTNLLLVVDQFEEIFRYRRLVDADEANAFVALLLESGRLADLPVHVVITMRSDFIGDCAVFRQLPEVINEGLFLVPRLTREQLRNAIEGPARVFGGRIEPRLVNHLLNSVGDDPDQLPVLQHALMRMCALAGGCDPDFKSGNGGFESTPSFTITFSHHQQVGGLKKALSLHADEAFEPLDEKQKAIARRLFQCLTERGPDQRDTRHPLRLGEITNIAEVDWKEVAAVVEHFRQPDRCFLTPSIPTPLAPDTLIDISHESLIRQWGRLNAWVDEEVLSATRYHRLEDFALQWKELKKSNISLLRPPFLDIARQWVQKERPNAHWAQRYGHHYELAMEYLHASEQQDKNEKAREEEARQQKLRDARERAEIRQRALNKTRWALFVVSLLLLITATTTYWAWREHGRTVEIITRFFNTKIANASEFIENKDFKAAREMLDDTKKLDKEAPPRLRHARNLLLWDTQLIGGTPDKQYPSPTTEESETIYRDITLSEDGRWLVAAGTDGKLVMLDPETLEPQNPSYDIFDFTQCKKQEIRKITIDPNSRWLAIGGDSGCVVLWNLEDKQIIDQWQVDRRVFAMASNHDGTLLAIAGADNSIGLCDPLNCKERCKLAGHTYPAHGLAFSPDGLHLLSVSYDNTLRLWDVNSCKELDSWHDDNKLSGVIAFHPNGSEVAVGRPGGRVDMWDVQRREVSRELLHHPGYRVTDLEFLLEGKLIVSSGTDNTLRLWDTETGVLLRVLQGHDGPITDITGRKDTIYSAGYDGKIMLWKANAKDTSNHTSQSKKPLDSIDFAALEIPVTQVTELPSRSVSAVALAPNNESTAVGFSDGQLKLYSLDGLEELWKKSDVNPQPGSNKPSDSVMMDYFYSSEGLTMLWKQSKAHANAVIGLAFESDGSRISSIDSDGHVKVWRTRDGSVSQTKISPSSVLNNKHKYAERAPDNSLEVGAVLSPDKWELLTLNSQESGAELEFWYVGHLDGRLNGPPDRPLTKPAEGIGLPKRLKGNAPEGLLFSIQVPSLGSDLQDFDFRCAERSNGKFGRCLISVASRSGKLMFYNLGIPYN